MELNEKEIACMGSVWNSFGKRNLKKNFPDEYEEYLKRVPAWIPRKREQHLEARK